MNVIKKLKLISDLVKGYSFSDPFKNGELRFLKDFIKPGMIVFDVGANIGEYTKLILLVNSSLTVHCFEPVKDSFERLRINLKEEILNNKIICNNFGLSDVKKKAEIFVYGNYAGSNSLYLSKYHSEKSDGVLRDEVSLTTIDEYAKQKKMSFINFVKIDVEGHEYNVLKGAENLLKDKLIETLQFEYGGFWKDSGNKLSMCFDLLSNNYDIFRLTSWGKISIRKYNSNLENYKHSNYVAKLKKY